MSIRKEIGEAEKLRVEDEAEIARLTREMPTEESLLEEEEQAARAEEANEELQRRIGELFPGPSKATRAYLHAEERRARMSRGRVGRITEARHGGALRAWSEP